VLTFLSYTLLHIALDQSNKKTIIIGWIIYTLQMISYIITVLKNPGIPTQTKSSINDSNKDQLKVCKICETAVPFKTKVHHCKECNICIIDYDHHCPWTSKCIGKENLKIFYIFVSLTIVLFSYLIYAVIFSKLRAR
jgi:palmitoyltransferase ZDHHC9/14/18